jgi:hypothetical protein
MNDEKLKSILEVNDAGHIRRRESSTLEFKANFNFGQIIKYAKTMSSFANNRGGILLFGVTNRPRIAKGMTNDKFNDIDPERIANELNNIFQPEIKWKIRELTIKRRRFGFIIIEESDNKPIVAKTNKGDLIKEGGIYYRYNARNELIKYAEMKGIIDSIKNKERKLWLTHLKQISHIGPEHAGVFNPKDGLIKGPSGSFIIDSSLLPSLQFIREGEFVEKDGAPTVKVIGNARVIGGDDQDFEGLIGIQEKAINQNDIIVSYLTQVSIRSPREYLKQICFEGIKYLPFYYYLRLARLGLESLEDILNKVQGYKIIVSRIDTDPVHLPYKLENTGSQAYKRKIEIRSLLRKGKYQISASRQELRYLLMVLRSLKNIDLIRNILIEIYRINLRKIDVLSDFRIAVCYLDYVENGSMF